MANIAGTDVTPNRKRKRDYEKEFASGKNACFINPAFNPTSSTPKKVLGRRRLLVPAKENINPLGTCMEVKSIAEIVEERKFKSEAPLTIPHNPYEVQRKPPKKKKREASIEEACFENPALNLNVPEKQFNPYEVVRDVNKNHEDKRKCFVNAALDIKTQDTASKIINPFEIIRGSAENNNSNDTSDVQPTRLAIGIPFTPTVGCRIDFNNIPLTQLTPSKLMLMEKLVFSPMQTNSTLPKRSLDAISEESSSVSIGKELDRYQLELENSINEAKIHKNDALTTETSAKEKDCVYQIKLKVEKRVSLSTKLSDIVESEEYETKSTEEIELTELKLNIENNTEEIKVEKTETNSKNHDNCNAGFTFDSDEEDNIDFKAPAPFVRAYRRDNLPKTHSKESVNSNGANKSSTENVAACKNKPNVVKNLIRKSIRKILPNNHDDRHQNVEINSDITKPKSETIETKDHEEKQQCTLSSHIMSSLRQSLRRRKPKPLGDPEECAAEISIIDTSERKMKLKSSLAQNEYARIEELTNEKKHLLRNGSLRRSTREMRHQIMKTLFHNKQEEYTLQK